MTLRGWRRADGYAGLEPRRQLDYRLLPALRVAGVRWVQRNPSTIAGLSRRADSRADDRLAGSARPAAPGAAGHADPNQQPPRRRHRAICPDTTALCEVPLGPARLEAGHGRADGRAARADWRSRSIAPPRNCWSWPKAITPAGTPPSTACRETLYRVNGDFMGCVVGPGKHRVMLSFRPDSLDRGWLTSWIWAGPVVRLFPRRPWPAETDNLEEHVPRPADHATSMPSTLGRARRTRQTLVQRRAAGLQRGPGAAAPGRPHRRVLDACPVEIRDHFRRRRLARREPASPRPVGGRQRPHPRHPPFAELRAPGGGAGGTGPRPRRRRRADGLRHAGRPRSHSALPGPMAGRLRRGLCHPRRSARKIC